MVAAWTTVPSAAVVDDEGLRAHTGHVVELLRIQVAWEGVHITGPVDLSVRHEDVAAHAARQGQADEWADELGVPRWRAPWVSYLLAEARCEPLVAS